MSEFTLNKKTCKKCQEMYISQEIDKQKIVLNKIIDTLLEKNEKLDISNTRHFSLKTLTLKKLIDDITSEIDFFNDFEAQWDFNKITACPCVKRSAQLIHKKPPLLCPFLHKHFNNKDS